MARLIMSSIATAAFSSPDAGSDYFATEAHYLSLAARVVAALRRGSSVVFVTGDPPPSAAALSQMLGAAAVWWYRVIDVVCGPETDRDQLLSRPVMAAAEAANDASVLAEKPPLTLPPLFVFDNGDRLSDRQVEEICQTLSCEGRGGGAGLLLARPSLLSRLEHLRPSWLQDSVTARLRFNELGREEVATFIRRQLRSEGREGALDADTITAIAEAAGGDPALVNHLSRLSLSFTAAATDAIREPPPAAMSTAGDRAADQSAAAAKTQPKGRRDTVAQQLAVAGVSGPSPGVPPVRRRAAWHWPIAIGLCLIGAGLLLVPKQEFGSLAHRAGIAPLAHKAQKLAAATLAGAITEIMRPIDAIAGSRSSEPDAASHKTTMKMAAAEQRQQPARIVPVDLIGPGKAAAADRLASAGQPGDPFAAASGPSKARVVMVNNQPGSGRGSGTATADPAERTPQRPATEPPAPVNNPGNGPSATTAPAASATAERPASSAARPSTRPATPIVATASLAAARPGPLANSPRLSPAEVTALIARGDAFVGLRDLASARLFYARAAAAGDGRAALRMGATYDPNFLDRAGITGLSADQQQAISWYRRARALGEAEAMHRLDEHNPTQ